MGGSSAPSNTTTTTELPAWARAHSEEILQRGAGLSHMEMPVFTGQRSADLNGNQTQAMQMTANRAMYGSQDINAGSNQLQSTLNGQYLNHDTGTNWFIGGQPRDWNAYTGDNPYLQGTIDKAAGDITRNYDSAVNGTDATFARAGAFGGSAWAQSQNDNSRNLAQSLSDSATSMRMQNYNQSAGLAENALARAQQAWQTNAGLAESGLSRNQAAYEGERGRQMAALSPALAYGNQAYTDAQQLAGAGDTRYAYDQQKVTDTMNQWNEQAQSPYKQLDILGNAVRAAVGGGGTVSQSAPGASVLGQGVGGAAALYSLFGK